MFRFFSRFMAVFMLFFSVAGLPLWAEELDAIAVVVGDDIITQQEWDQAVSQAGEIDREAVLNDLMKRRLQLQLAQHTNIVVDDEALQGAMQQLARQNNMNAAQLQQAVKLQGMSYKAFRQRIREDLIISRLRQREVESRITVSAREVDQYLSTQQTQGKQVSSYRLQHILLAVDDDAAWPVARRWVADIAEALDQGRSVDDILQQQPDVFGLSLEGGDLGWVSQSHLPTIFADVVPDMALNTHSAALRSDSGFHWVYVQDKRLGSVQYSDQVLFSVVSVSSSPELGLEDARKRVMVWRTEIAQGKTGIMPPAAEQTWQDVSQLDKPTQQALEGLQDDGLSDPYLINGSWHLARLWGRRRVDVSEQRLRQEAQQVLFMRKVKQAYDAWLDRLLDNAYIERRYARAAGG